MERKRELERDRERERENLLRRAAQESEGRVKELDSRIARMEHDSTTRVEEIRAIINQWSQMHMESLDSMHEKMTSRMEHVSNAQIAEVRDIVNQWSQMSERHMEILATRVDSMVGGHVARMEQVVKSFRASARVVPLMIFAYLMMYKYAGRLGPWRAIALGVVLFLAVDQYFLLVA